MSIVISPFDNMFFDEKKPPREKGASIIDFPNEYVVIDTETTGLDTEYCDIIEIAGIKYKDGKEISHFSELVKPRSYFIDDDEDVIDDEENDEE